MSKPIDLIVANHMYAVVDGATSKLDLLKSLGLQSKEFNLDYAIKHGTDFIARDLLCKIAHGASLDKVYAALKAVGAPASSDMIQEGVQAVRDRQ